MDIIKVLMILRLVITTSSGALWSSTTAIPKRCPPGQYMLDSAADSPCQHCPAGTFMPDYNVAAECRQHIKCVANEIYLFDGNSTADAVCQCRSGWEREYEGRFYLGSHVCQPCAGGKVAQTVPDSHPGDTLCCLPEEIPKRTLTIRYCNPRSPDSPPLHQTTVQPSTAIPDESKNCSPVTQNALGALFGILLIAVVAFVAIIVFGRLYPKSLCGTCVPPFFRANKPAGGQYITDY